MNKQTTQKQPHGHRYDLPLNKGEGAGFLLLLTALMTTLGVLALAASFTLSAMTARWTTGLADQVTIEIPTRPNATDFTPEPALLSQEELTTLSEEIAASITKLPATRQVQILSKEDITALIEPWLGSHILTAGDMPLPAMLSVTLQENSTSADIEKLRDRLKALAPQARLDTHEDWLRDLTRFTGALQFAATLLTLIIGLTMVTAIAGGVRARMAIHSAEIELLHIMGAAAPYISRQFQRHALILGVKGALLGTALGGILLLIIGWLGGKMDINLLPDFSLTPLHIACMAALPLLIGTLATITARQTVLRVLAQMP